MKTLLRLLRYVRPHAGWAAVAVVGMVGVAISMMFLVFLISPIFDVVLGADLSGAKAALGAADSGKAAALPNAGVVKELRQAFESAKAGLGSHLPSDTAVILLLGFLTVLVKNLLTYFGHYASTAPAWPR